MTLSRRLFLTGLIAAPIIVRPGILMPVRPLPRDWIYGSYFGGCEMTVVAVAASGFRASGIGSPDEGSYFTTALGLGLRPGDKIYVRGFSNIPLAS